MPLTKKAGALFSIYADSPVQESSSSATAMTTTIRQASKRSPTKQRPTTGRKVLGTVSKPSPALDPMGNPIKDAAAAGVKVGLKTKSTTHDVTSPEIKKVAARRKHETSMQATAVPRGEAMSTSVPMTDDTRTPAKKTRTTPRRSAAAVHNHNDVTAEQENTAPADSPASRTRSKTRAVEASPSVPRTASALATPRRLEALIGDGRGALSTSSGRAVARYLKSADDGDMREMDEIMQGEQVIGKGKSARVVALLQRHEQSGLASSSTPSKGKGKANAGGKGRAVMGDGPLADVSEAYGATGEEPAGFRDCELPPSGQV